MRPQTIKTLIFIAVLFFASIHPYEVGAAQCSASATPLTFTTYSPLSSQSSYSTTGLITLFCTDVALPIHIKLSMSAGSSGDSEHRRMYNPEHPGRGFLQYTVSLHPNGPTFGDTAAGELFMTEIAPSATPVRLEVPFFAVIPGRQRITAGEYTDSSSVTVDY